MSKIGNYRVGLQETDDYQWGWQSAERGEPKPDWGDTPTPSIGADTRFEAQSLGWDDYHAQDNQS